MDFWRVSNLENNERAFKFNRFWFSRDFCELNYALWKYASVRSVNDGQPIFALSLFLSFVPFLLLQDFYDSRFEGLDTKDCDCSMDGG